MYDDIIDLIGKSQAGDKEARDEVFHRNIGLIWSLVKRFSNRGYDSEELFQIGSIGLIKAIDKFDTSFEVRFSTYAVPMIIGEIKRFIRDDGIIKVSRSLKELNNKYYFTKEKLNNMLNREPTMEEIAKELDAKVEDIIVAIEATSEVESLNKTIYQNENKPLLLIDKIKNQKNEIESMLNHIMLKKVLTELPDIEQQIIKKRYFHDQTQTQVAKSLGLSQVQISRMEKKILSKMRSKILA